MSFRLEVLIFDYCFTVWFYLWRAATHVQAELDMLVRGLRVTFLLIKNMLLSLRGWPRSKLSNLESVSLSVNRSVADFTLSIELDWTNVNGQRRNTSTGQLLHLDYVI